MIFRRYKEGDEEQIISLLNKVFKGWHNKQYWTWKFKTVEKIFNNSSIIWVAEEDNKIVGHLAAVPAEMKIGDSSVQVAQIVDGATHPKHRQKGIFKNLIDKISADAKKEDFYAIFGFSNVPAFNVFKKKLPWLDFCEITQIFKIANFCSTLRKLRTENQNSGPHTQDSNRLVSRADRMNVPDINVLINLMATVFKATVAMAKPKNHIKDPNISITASNLIEEETQNLWQKSSNKYNVALERKTKNLIWRYRNPEAKYTTFNAHSLNNGQLNGYSVATIEQTNLKIGRLSLANLRIGHVMDILTRNEKIFCLILSRLEQDLVEHEVDLVHCWAIRNGPNYHLYQKMGFYPFPENLGKITFWLHTCEKMESQDILWNPEKILISLGDSDLY